MEDNSMSTRLYFLVGVTALLLGGVSLAEEMRGVIIQVRPDQGEVVVEGRGRGVRGMNFTFLIDPNTRIQAGRQATRLENLPVGKHARVAYEDRDGVRVALTITVPGIVVKPETPAARTRPAAPPEEGMITGTLQRVALTDREIVVVSPGPSGEVETTFGVPENASITKNAKTAKLEDLQEGESVAVRPEKRNGKMIAAAIQVGAAPAKAAAAAPDRKIERLRQALRLADWILGQLGDANKGSDNPRQ
jgi:hypothetical protein